MPQIKAVLMEAPSRPAIEQLPERAGYHVAKFVDFCTEDVIRTGIEYAKDLKNRYTLLNLLQDVGLIRRFTAQMPLLADRNKKWKLSFKHSPFGAQQKGGQHRCTVPHGLVMQLLQLVANLLSTLVDDILTAGSQVVGHTSVIDFVELHGSRNHSLAQDTLLSQGGAMPSSASIAPTLKRPTVRSSLVEAPRLCTTSSVPHVLPERDSTAMSSCSSAQRRLNDTHCIPSRAFILPFPADSLIGRDELKSSEIKLRTRQEDECHRTHAARDLQAERLLMTSIPRKLRNLRNFITIIILNTHRDRMM